LIKHYKLDLAKILFKKEELLVPFYMLGKVKFKDKLFWRNILRGNLY